LGLFDLNPNPRGEHKDNKKGERFGRLLDIQDDARFQWSLKGFPGKKRKTVRHRKIYVLLKAGEKSEAVWRPPVLKGRGALTRKIPSMRALDPRAQKGVKERLAEMPIIKKSKKKKMLSPRYEAYMEK